jgi:hypothetical protein
MHNKITDHMRPYGWTPEQRQKIMHQARQIRPVRTNPGSYRIEEFDDYEMPLVGVFTD